MAAPYINISPAEISEASKKFPRNASIKDYYKITKSESKTYTYNQKTTDNENSVKILKTDVFKKYRNVQKPQNHFTKTNLRALGKLKNYRVGKDHNTNSTKYMGLFNDLLNNTKTEQESLLPSTLKSSSQNDTETSAFLNVFSSDKISIIKRDNVLNNFNIRNNTEMSKEERKIDKNIENSAPTNEILRKFLRHYQKPSNIKPEVIIENMRQKETNEGKDIFNNCNVGNENNNENNGQNIESIKTKVVERKMDNVEHSAYTNESLRKFLQYYQRPNPINSETMNEDTGMIQKVNGEDMIKSFNARTENKDERGWQHNKNNKLTVNRKISNNIGNPAYTNEILRKYLLHYQKPNYIKSGVTNENMKQEEKNEGKYTFNNSNVRNKNNTEKNRQNIESIELKVVERKIDVEHSAYTNESLRKFLQCYQRPNAINSENIIEDTGKVEKANRKGMFINFSAKTENKAERSWQQNEKNKLNINRKIGNNIENSARTSESLKNDLHFQLPANMIIYDNNNRENWESNVNIVLEQKIDKSGEYSNCTNDILRKFLQCFQRPLNIDSEKINEDTNKLQKKRKEEKRSINIDSEKVNEDIENLQKKIREDMFKNLNVRNDNNIGLDWEHNKNIKRKSNNNVENSASNDKGIKKFLRFQKSDNTKSESVNGNMEKIGKTAGGDYFKNVNAIEENVSTSDSENNKSTTKVETAKSSYLFENKTILQDISKSQLPKEFVDQNVTKDNEKCKSVAGHNSLMFRTDLHQNNYDVLKKNSDAFENYKIKNFKTPVKHNEQLSPFVLSQIETSMIQGKSKNIETADVKQLFNPEHIVYATVHENAMDKAYINLQNDMCAAQRSSVHKGDIPSEKSTTTKNSERLGNLLKNACLKEIYTSTKNNISKEIDRTSKEHQTENVTSEPSYDASRSSPDDDLLLMLSKEYEKHKKRQQLIDSETDSNGQRFLKCVQKTSLDVKSRNKRIAYVKRLKKGNIKICRLKKFRKNVTLNNEMNGTKTCIKEVIEKLTQNYIEPESQLRKSVSLSSKSTSSSCVTDGSKWEITADPEKFKNTQDFDMFLKKESLLFEGKPECVPYYDANDILRKIRNVFVVVYEDIVNEREPVLEYRRHDFKKYVQDTVELKTCRTKISSKSKRSSQKFKLILLLMKKIQALLETNTKVTKRELFYQMKHFVKNQNYIDRAINAISCILDVGPWAFNVVSQKGLVLGDLKIFTTHGSVVDCNISATLIPQDIEDIAELHSTARFILVVEKEAVFQKLIDEDFQAKLKLPFIMITGKGYPDLNTQLFLRKLWTTMALPVFILVDADPHGIQIMLNYKFGSFKNAHLSHHLAVPKAKWIGVYPSEIHKFEITTEPLSVGDLNRINNLLRNHYMDKNPEIVAELKVMLQHKLKAGIEGLIRNDIFLSDVYLTMKFINHSFI
ncbi:uncharacterized protein mei-W68 [Diabrotica undecimpunctata]|uniref:uncharacterized protein mei-W68 n=1 Tax=Diabrotica undecimpunctata TaxID=50387 RepID=UPI003B63CD7B